MAVEEFSLANVSVPPSFPGTGFCVERNSWFCHLIGNNVFSQYNFAPTLCFYAIVKNCIPAEVTASKNSKLSSQIMDHLHRHEERAEEHNDQSAEGCRFSLIPTRRREKTRQVKGPESQAADSRGNWWFRKEADCTDWCDWHTVRGQNWNSKKPPTQEHLNTNTEKTNQYSSIKLKHSVNNTFSSQLVQHKITQTQGK